MPEGKIAENRTESILTTDMNEAELTYAEILWKAADALRGQIDAAEYKHVVLGLLFLKYVSDSFEARRDELKAELAADGIVGPQLESLLENRDEYAAERIFWVPREARWHELQSQAARADIAALLDDAILAVERDNSGLKGQLPRDYARRGIAPEKLKGLIDLIADIGFKDDRAKARDMLGRVLLWPQTFARVVHAAWAVGAGRPHLRPFSARMRARSRRCAASTSGSRALVLRQRR